MHKSNFPIFTNNPQLVYLDNSATTQKPQVVIDSITNFYSNSNANIHRGIYKLAEKATLLYEKSRGIIADFLGAHASEIIFTSGATESLNLLAYMLLGYFQEKKQANSCILVSEMEHHSNLIPWQIIAKRLGWKLEYIKTKKDFTIDFKDLREKLNRNTVILSLTHMSNVTGTINDIESITKLAKEMNPEIFTVVDGAQFVPHYSINLQIQKNIDFYVFSGHKMFGPTGTGILYGKLELLEQLEPAKYGGGMISEVKRDNSTWGNIPDKFEAGTPNIAGVVGLGTAINYLTSIRSQDLEVYMEELIQYTDTKLRELSELTIYRPKGKLCKMNTIFSFSIPNIHPHDISQLLDNDNIAIRAGHHCCQILHRDILKVPATSRISLCFYNDKSDIDKLSSSLKSIIKRFK